MIARRVERRMATAYTNLVIVYFAVLNARYLFIDLDAHTPKIPYVFTVAEITNSTGV
jgi:Mrp family chromosome partitioning ATPase